MKIPIVFLYWSILLHIRYIFKDSLSQINFPLMYFFPISLMLIGKVSPPPPFSCIFCKSFVLLLTRQVWSQNLRFIVLFNILIRHPFNSFKNKAKTHQKQLQQISVYKNSPINLFRLEYMPFIETMSPFDYLMSNPLFVTSNSVSSSWNITFLKQ